MPLNILKLEIEDINTSTIGNNIQIRLTDNNLVVFSRSALEKMFKDYRDILEAEKPADKNYNTHYESFIKYTNTFDR